MAVGDNRGAQVDAHLIGKILGALESLQEDRRQLHAAVGELGRLSKEMAVLAVKIEERQDDLDAYEARCKKKESDIAELKASHSKLESCQTQLKWSVGTLAAACVAAAIGFWQFVLPHLTYRP